MQNMTHVYNALNHWDVGKTSLGFRPDPIRTLVSTATDSFNRVIIGKNGFSARFLGLFSSDLF